MLRNFFPSVFLIICGCTPDFQEVDTTVSISSTMLENKETVVILKNDSYIEPEVKLATYSGSFEKLTDNEDLSKVMDAVINFANKRVPESSYANAYSVPTVFAKKDHNKTLFTDYTTEQNNVFTMVESIRQVDPNEDLSVEAIRKDKDNPDFFSFGINSNIDKSSDSSDVVFFDSSNIIKN